MMTMTLPDVVVPSPHADDDTVSLGAEIRLLIEAGHRVFVLLQTTGQNSGVFPGTGLSITDFIAARDDEMRRAVRKLGVRTENLIIAPDRTQDGQLTVAAAQDMLAAVLLDHPGAWVKCYSNLILPAPLRHPDHIASGQAAWNLLQDGTIGDNDLRMFVEPWRINDFTAAHPGVHIGTDRAAGKAIVQGAYDEYTARDAAGFKFGIGGQSIGAELAAGRVDPVSLWHVPVAA
jgi:LmbE family N-acetylglucosaminyl deacetylase